MAPRPRGWALRQEPGWALPGRPGSERQGPARHSRPRRAPGPAGEARRRGPTRPRARPPWRRGRPRPAERSTAASDDLLEGCGQPATHGPLLGLSLKPGCFARNIVPATRAPVSVDRAVTMAREIARW